jgi:hypothetical protein
LSQKRLLFRAWYYFRTGYSLYVAFPLGFISTVIVVYSLGIKPVIESNPPTALGDFLQLIFPRLTSFIIIGAFALIPLCIAFGLYHTKRTGPYEADASVMTEQNPYVYKAIPGKEMEVFIPLWLLTAKALAKILDQQNIMTIEEKQAFDKAIQKAVTLVEGKMVGVKPKPS